MDTETDVLFMQYFSARKQNLDPVRRRGLTSSSQGSLNAIADMPTEHCLVGMFSKCTLFYS